MAVKKTKRRRADDAGASVSFQAHPVRLLLVDDDPRDLQLARITIEQITTPVVELIEACSVAEALRVFDTSEVDICIADFRLGGETALDLFRAARNHSHLMPFIAITGVMDEETTAHTLLIAGFDDVLLKSDLQVANIYRIVRNSWLRNAHTRQLLEHSTVDELTGVANRRGALLRLEVERARAQRLQLPLAVLFMDINGFKNINDRWGHAAGDRALIHLARTLESLLRKSDILARMGGDEFVVAMPATSRPMADVMIERIRKALASSPIRFQDQDIQLEVSMGIGTLDPKSEVSTLAQLLKEADRQMYRNKKLDRRSAASPSAKNSLARDTAFPLARSGKP